MIELSISANCHKGVVRDNNEDMLLVSGHCSRDCSLITKVDIGPRGRYIVAIADGMGGYDEGEVASEMTLHSLSDFFAQLPSGLSVEDLRDVTCEWGELIHDIVNEDASAHGVVRGTTLVALAVYEDKMFFINCGDSRMYRYRDGVLSQLTDDHNLASLTGKFEDKHVVVNCIGVGAESSYMDFVDMSNRMFNEDLFLLCSDGLSDMCSDSEIEEALRLGHDANDLVALANRKGGLDNVSVINVKVNIL